MNAQELEFVARLVKERSGLVVGADKAYLLESRLSPVARREGLASVSELINTVRTRRDEKLIWEITEAMTTNETFWFRDKTPFELFEGTVLPELTERKARGRARIWCAACSTGQEPYSLAMILDQKRAALNGMTTDILATDISTKVLEKAKAGAYSQFEVQRGLPVKMLVKYFEKSDEIWRINAQLRQNIAFRQVNLLDNFASVGKFDVVFCRNVLIYFDPPTKSKVLDRIASQMEEDGYLFLGAAETVMGLTKQFSPVPGKRGLYQKVSAARVAAA